MSETLSHVPKKRKIITSLHAGIFCLGLLAGIGLTSAGTNYLEEKTVLSAVTANSGLPENLDYTSVEEVYDSLRKNYDGELSAEDLLSGLKAGLAEATGDPYTAYLTPEENEEFQGDVNGTFTGIGAELVKEDGIIMIATPLSGYPAEKAGVRARDMILKINGEDATTLSVTDAVKVIRGEKGTDVTLSLLRGEDQLEVTITRDTINIPSVTHSVADGIGYLNIARFGNDTAELSRRAAEEFKLKNVSGVVVDLRNNPGGYLDQAVRVASLWLPSGETVVEEKRAGATVRVDRAVGNNLLAGLKTIVLINGGSASASEILAGALKDHGAATLYGEKTFGKGSVQQLDNLISGAALKVTIARWHTPSGANIDKEGIKPDKEVKVTEADITSGSDPQKAAATKALK